MELESNFEIDDFAEALRAISHQRRQGTLSVSSAVGEFEIDVCDGLIITARRSDNNAAISIIERLVSAGLVPATFLEAVKATPVSTNRLVESAFEWNPEIGILVQRSRRAYELDLLHAIGNNTKSSVSFTPAVIGIPACYSLALAPGQFLLDLLDCNDLRQRFLERTSSQPLDECIVERHGYLNQALLPDEQIIWEILAEPRSLKELWLRSLLPHVHFVEGVLGLWEQGLLGLAGQADLETADDICLPCEDLLFGESESELLHPVDTIEPAVLPSDGRNVDATDMPISDYPVDLGELEFGESRSESADALSTGGRSSAAGTMDDLSEAKKSASKARGDGVFKTLSWTPAHSAFVLGAVFVMTAVYQLPVITNSWFDALIGIAALPRA